MDLYRVKAHLRIDFDDDDIYLNDLIAVSDIYISNCVGEGFRSNERAVKLKELLQLKLIADMYENRGKTITGKGVKQDEITTTILDMLSNYSEEE